MPRFDCPCGFTSNLETEDNTFVVAPKKHYPRMLEIEKDLARLDPSASDFEQRSRELHLLLLSLKSRICECPRCGRLAWYRGQVTQPVFYWLDE